MEIKINALQIDLARQKEKIEFVKEYLDFAKKCGYNSIVFYLENVVRTPDTEYFDKNETYSMAEMQEMVDYGVSLGLDVIPCYENLAHLEKFFKYDQLKHLSELENNSQGRGLYGNPRGRDGCISNPELLKFCNKYISDVDTIFKSKYLFVCMDEPFDLAVCDRCRKRLEQGVTKEQMFLEHVLKTYEFAKSLGKTLIIADDFFQYANIAEKIPNDIILFNWNYLYIDDELDGLWVDRIKKDWLSYYDRIGKKYICAVKSYVGSPTYNIDSYYDYAKKHKPLGFCNTLWCRSDNFYFSSYPLIEYTAKLINGEIENKESLSLSKNDAKTKLYAQILNCSEHCAESILATDVTGLIGNPFTTDYVEADTLLKRTLRKSSKILLKEIEKELKDTTDLQSIMLHEIYYSKLAGYNNLRLTRIINQVFDCYQTGEDQAQFIPELVEIRDGYIKENEFLNQVWAKYRDGIKSCNGDFEKKKNNRLTAIDNLIEKLKTNEKKGILYYEYVMPEGYQTSRTRLTVKYKGEDKETIIYNRGLKPAFAANGETGISIFKVAIENKPIEYLKCALYGEGYICPVRIRYLANGVKYVASKVEYLSGHVEKMEKILSNGSEFATLGVANGVAHFNDFSLSKVVHEIKVEFEVL